MGCCSWGREQADEPADPTQWSSVLDRRRADAERSLQAAAGGDGLCRLDASSELERIKQAEGALAVISELQRDLRREPSAQLPSRAATLLDRWREQQTLAAVRGRAWEAYRAGGIGELEMLVDELGALEPR